MPETKDLEKLCERDREFAQMAALIWRLDLRWRGRDMGTYRIRDLDDSRQKLGAQWIKYGQIEFLP